MKYRANTHMSPESLDIVKNIIGEQISDILIATAGDYKLKDGLYHNMGLLITLKTESGEIAIFSEPIVIERDELPRLRVEVCPISSETRENTFFDERENIVTGLGYPWGCKKLIGASYIRDTLEWNSDNNECIWEFDAGLKLFFEDTILLIMARESGAGMMEFWIGPNQEWTKDPKNFIKNYFFEIEDLEKIEREEVPLTKNSSVE